MGKKHRHRVFPASSIIGQKKSPGDYKGDPSKVTLEDITQMVKDISGKIKSESPFAMLGVGAIMNCDDEMFMALLSPFSNVKVVGTEEGLKPVYERYNKLKNDNII